MLVLVCLIMFVACATGAIYVICASLRRKVFGRNSLLKGQPLSLKGYFFFSFSFVITSLLLITVSNYMGGPLRHIFDGSVGTVSMRPANWPPMKDMDCQYNSLQKIHIYVRDFSSKPIPDTIVTIRLYAWNVSDSLTIVEQTDSNGYLVVNFLPLASSLGNPYRVSKFSGAAAYAFQPDEYAVGHHEFIVSIANVHVGILSNHECPRPWRPELFICVQLLNERKAIFEHMIAPSDSPKIERGRDIKFSALANFAVSNTAPIDLVNFQHYSARDTRQIEFIKEDLIRGKLRTSMLDSSILFSGWQKDEGYGHPMKNAPSFGPTYLSSYQLYDSMNGETLCISPTVIWPSYMVIY